MFGLIIREYCQFWYAPRLEIKLPDSICVKQNYSFEIFAVTGTFGNEPFS